MGDGELHRTDMFGQAPIPDTKFQETDAIRRRSAVLAWVSVLLFLIGLFLPLMGDVNGLTALFFGWSGSTFLPWSAAPLFFWSVGSLMFKRPGLATATLAMLAFATTYWVMPGIDTGWNEETGEFTRVGVQIGYGFVLWSACVVVNFGRALYHQVAEHRLNKNLGHSAHQETGDEFVNYPRDVKKLNERR